MTHLLGFTYNNKNGKVMPENRSPSFETLKVVCLGAQLLGGITNPQFYHVPSKHLS